MNKVTYLMGAGASFGSVPLVKEIPRRLLEFIDQLRLPAKALQEHIGFNYSKPENDFLNKLTKRQLQLELIEYLNWLHGLLTDQPELSIDTIAKQLSLMKKVDEVEKLKVCLSIFLTVEQIIYGVNPRYDMFFASILETLNELPKNINIISWNYDYQFEMAYNRLTGFDKLQLNQEALGVVSKNSSGNKIKLNQFAIFKINGTASYYDRSSVFERNDLNIFRKQQHTLELVEEIVKYFGVVRYSTKLTPLLSFAWETDSDDLIGSVIESTKDTTDLVIIGYSFPTFNKEIDRRILESMDDLQTVHIQAPQSVIYDIEKKFRSTVFASEELTFNHESNVGQFHLI